jgi:hypothetical protein
VDDAAEDAEAAGCGCTSADGGDIGAAFGEIDDELLALGEIAIVLEGDAAGADVVDANNVGGAGFAVVAGGDEDGGTHADARLAALFGIDAV